MRSSPIGLDYQRFLEAATADENVVGLVLSGSRGAGHFVTERSDFDIFVVQPRADGRWLFEYGSSVEAVAITIEEFENYALPGYRDSWNRPAFLYASVELDSLATSRGASTPPNRSRPS